MQLFLVFFLFAFPMFLSTLISGLYAKMSLAHIMNICPVGLKQYRFTWRHGSILQHITSAIKKVASTDIEVLSDLPWHRFYGKNFTSRYNSYKWGRIQAIPSGK